MLAEIRELRIVIPPPKTGAWRRLIRIALVQRECAPRRRPHGSRASGRTTQARTDARMHTHRTANDVCHTHYLRYTHAEYQPTTRAEEVGCLRHLGSIKGSGQLPQTSCTRKITVLLAAASVCALLLVYAGSHTLRQPLHGRQLQLRRRFIFITECLQLEKKRVQLAKRGVQADRYVE